MAQTKIQKIFRFAIYSLVGAGVLGVIVFGISNLNNGAVVSAQSEQISSQTIIEDAASSKPETFKTIVGPW